MDATTKNPIPADEVSLKEVLEAVWRRKWSGVLLTVVCTVAAAVAAWVMPKTYKASIIVSAVTSEPGSEQLGGLSSVVSEFSGLASLAGLSLHGDSRKDESVAVLQSEALTESYIRENHLLQVLYPKKWDAQQQRWKEHDSTKVPTVWKANQYFKRHIRTVSTDAHTGLVTLTIKWTDPQLAAKWANDLVKETNDYLRGKAIAESDRNIAYLNEQALKTDTVGVRQAIYTILQNEIDKEMLARGSDEYALKVIDPAVPPEEPASPQPLLWTLAGLFAGVLLTLFAAFARVAWAKG